MDEINTLVVALKECDVAVAKLRTLDLILGLIESEEGLDLILKKGNSVFAALVDLSYHSNEDIARKATIVLVNVSSQSNGVSFLISMKLSPQVVLMEKDVCKSNSRDAIFPVLFDHLLGEMSSVTQYAVMILVNLSRSENNARVICDSLQNLSEIIEMIANFAVKTDTKYDYLTSLIGNLCQLIEVRRILMESIHEIFRKLLSLIDYKDTLTRRRGVICIIRNLCLSVENHEKLLDPKVGLLSRLLLPLAGPEEFDDEDNEKLPLELQYLPADKLRESDVSIRKQLLEIIMQFCSTKFGRELMRKYNAYVILRELHKWETNEECLIICEDVVNIIIRTEEEIGADNLRNIEIPADLAEKFDDAMRVNS